MSLRVPLLFALCVPLASCFQTLDTTASSAGPIEVPADRPADFQIPDLLTAKPDIQLDLEDETATTKDECVKVKKDAFGVLGKYCTQCHGGGEGQAQANFTFVLDDAKLTDPNTLSSGKQRFVVPGDCSHSLLYQRVAAGDMPPKVRNVGDPVYPHPTVSEVSVLHTWITNCTGAPPVTPPKPDAGGPAPGVPDAGTRPAADAGMTPAREAGGPVTPPPGPTADAAPEAAVVPPADAGVPPREAGPVGGMSPCAGICQNPTRIQQRPFNSGNVGGNAVCFDLVTMPTSWACANFDFMRSLSINMQRVNCGMPPATNTIAPRNGGYCFSAPGGGNPAANFSVQ